MPKDHILGFFHSSLPQSAETAFTEYDFHKIVLIIWWVTVSVIAVIIDIIHLKLLRYQDSADSNWIFFSRLFPHLTSYYASCMWEMDPIILSGVTLYIYFWITLIIVYLFFVDWYFLYQRSMTYKIVNNSCLKPRQISYKASLALEEIVNMNIRFSFPKLFLDLNNP